MENGTPSKKTNPPGKGTVNMSTNVTHEMRQALGAIAEASGYKIGEYCRALFQLAIEEKIAVKIKQQSKVELLDKNPPQ